MALFHGRENEQESKTLALWPLPESRSNGKKRPGDADRGAEHRTETGTMVKIGAGKDSPQETERSCARTRTAGAAKRGQGMDLKRGLDRHLAVKNEETSWLAGREANRLACVFAREESNETENKNTGHCTA
jgi:hypothetical protein